MASPGIMTGFILAMARAAGEVAPLMITGVVKLAPQLPLDGSFPFFHLDRKFMHLGFHIYDIGFQVAQRGGHQAHGLRDHVVAVVDRAGDEQPGDLPAEPHAEAFPTADDLKCRGASVAISTEA